MSDVKVIDDGGPAHNKTLRDEFAMAVIQGMFSCQDFLNEVARMSASKDECCKTIAAWSYMHADAMLAVRRPSP